MRSHEAVKVYLTNSKRATKTVNVIEKWNGNKTLAENAKELLNGKVSNAYQLAKRFKLSYRKVRGAKMIVKTARPVQEKSPAKELVTA